MQFKELIEETADAYIQTCGITCDYTYDPWDGNGEPRLKWAIQVRVHGDPAWSGHFTAGVGHAPSYPAMVSHDECRTGKSVRGMRITPPLRDVVASLCLDAGALDYASFEDWAGEFGMDTDSRKAFAMYQQCLQCGIALRAALGSERFDHLKEVCSQL
jgi:hypothetical protein